MEPITGMISNIQRMSVHDGPGIRTTVFLKGCNMRCQWCHNPEAIHTQPEYVFNEKLCQHCGMCAQGCFSGARVLCGQQMTAEEVMQQVRMDKVYYADDGGITVSGGEPFMQADFTVELLRLAKAEGLRCGVETNSSLPFERMERALPWVDLWMTDLKLFDSAAHQRFTGIPNEQIRENIRRLDKAGARIVLRTPVIPGVNDAPEELERIMEFAAELRNLEYYEALPYHPLGLSKEVQNTEFIHRFEVPDKAALRQMMVPMAQKHGVHFRLANVAMA